MQGDCVRTHARGFDIPLALVNSDLSMMNRKEDLGDDNERQGGC